MIELSSISKRYATPQGTVTALEGIDLSIREGEIFGVIGKSGAGKSTLIRLINLLERPDQGSVRVAGRDLTALPPASLRRARQEIGMIFQHFNLLATRTVFENIALPLELRGESKASIRATVEPLLDLVGLTDKRERYPSELSGGQKQRVGIARALATQPRVLLSDEATSALDPETTRSILALLKDINARLGLTIVLITHEMSVIKEVADRVAVLEQGKVIELGPVYDVFTRPRAETTRRFVGELVGGDLPPSLLRQIANDTATTDPTRRRVLRIRFTGGAAESPVMSTLARRFDLDFNLLHGRLDEIQGRPFGNLVVELLGDPAKLDAATKFLATQQLGVESLNYEQESGDVVRLDRAAG
ncbi:methionine ABC transporter ATP-binding protein [Ferrovibrio sp. MS7]|uniref:methionine ABC transporter ATP-binding protein n=1 Tax=Ferrovibrio plantarum TaxID=3119164 RepID=UPI0031367DE4